MSKVHSTVTFWWDNPLTTDSCDHGEDFDTLDEADEYFVNQIRHMGDKYRFIMLDSPDLNKPHIVENPNYKASPDNDDDWRHEMAMEAGMAFGCDGYNDMMGY